MFYTSQQPFKAFAPFTAAGQGRKFGYGDAADFDSDKSRLASQGADIFSSVVTTSINAGAARKLEQEKRKTASVTKKYDSKISASQAKQEASRAKAAAAEAEARRVEAEQAARIQTTKYMVFGGVGIAALLASLLIVKTFKRNPL
jgi:hypothetical protein